MQNKWLKRKTPHNCSASAGTIKKPFSIGNVIMAQFDMPQSI